LCNLINPDLFVGILCSPRDRSDEHRQQHFCSFLRSAAADVIRCVIQMLLVGNVAPCILCCHLCIIYK
jgi:hypothetical protein